VGDERWDRGAEKIRELSGVDALERVDELARGAPELGRWIVEFIFGDIYSRPGLSLRDRQIANIAALTALGTAPATLRVHINGALNVGVSEQEVLEIVLQMAAYAGFPAAANGLAAAREVFAARDAP
jgi:4-carboxymuconolactone decarboxylase